jgi:hypothetical protein
MLTCRLPLCSQKVQWHCGDGRYQRRCPTQTSRPWPACVVPWRPPHRKLRWHSLEVLLRLNIGPSDGTTGFVRLLGRGESFPSATALHHRQIGGTLTRGAARSTGLTPMSIEYAALAMQAPHLALPLADAFSASGAVAAALDCATLPWRLRVPPPAGPLGQPTGSTVLLGGCSLLAHAGIAQPARCRLLIHACRSSKHNVDSATAAGQPVSCGGHASCVSLGFADMATTWCAGATDLQSLARLLQGGQASGLAALRVALPAPDLPPDPQVISTPASHQRRASCSHTSQALPPLCLPSLVLPTSGGYEYGLLHARCTSARL